VNEKLAASLILLREALLPGLFVDKRLFMSGAGSGLVTEELSVLPGCSGGSSAAGSSDSALSNVTHKYRLH